MEYKCPDCGSTDLSSTNKTVTIKSCYRCGKIDYPIAFEVNGNSESPVSIVWLVIIACITCMFAGYMIRYMIGG